MEYQVSSRFFHLYVWPDQIGLKPITKDKVLDYGMDMTESIM